MPLITDAAIRAALRRATDDRTVTLTDPAPRGAGRLVLRIRAGSALWFGVHYVGGQRRMRQLGRWPQVSVARARELFGGAGTAPAEASTCAQLFEARLAWLEQHQPGSVRNARQILDAAAATIGRRSAASIAPEDIAGLIRPVYARGSRGQAKKWRQALHGAFRWALQSAHDYTQAGGRDWGLRSNPVDGVPTDPTPAGVGQRWLDADEFVGLLRHLLRRPEESARRFAVLMLTGQRVREIARLRPEQWDSEQKVLQWDTTKTGVAHAVPVCELVARLLDASTWEPVHDEAMRATCRRHQRRTKCEPFSARDMRRTWKTLAGAAGLTKAERDLLQNHAPRDVSARHYDRWSAMPEKRAALAKWERWLSEQLGEAHAEQHTQQVVQAQQDAQAQRV